MAEKSALRLIPGKDALLQYTPAVYAPTTYVEYQGSVYKSLVTTSPTFVPTEWELISDPRTPRVPNIASRNALTGSTPTSGTTGIHIPILDNTDVLVLDAIGDPQVAAHKFAIYNYNKTTNSFLLLQVSTGSTSSNVSDYNLLTNKPPIISGITATAGAGLTGGGVFSGGVPPTRATFTFSHADTSSQANINVTGLTYVQNLRFDTYGHVTGATTSSWVHPDTSSQPSVNGTGFTYIQSIGVDTDGHITSIGQSTWVHPDTSSQGNVINTGNTVIQSISLDTDGHVTGINSVTVSGGGGGGVNFSAAGDVGGSIAMPNGGILEITGGSNIQTVSTLHANRVGVRINVLAGGSNNQVQLNNSGVLAGGVGLFYTGNTTLVTPKLLLSVAPTSGSTNNQFLTRNPSTGNIERLSIAAIPAPPINSIQYNSGVGFGGKSVWAFDPTVSGVTLGTRSVGTIGQFSLTVGSVNVATGFSSFAGGQNSKAYGLGSFAYGSNAKASGFYSFAIGANTQALSSFDHAEGGSTVASGGTSHAEGNNTIAGGSNSHAQGIYTFAKGVNSFAGGVGANATLVVLAAGTGSINLSTNSVSQTTGFGALANQSAIIGGQDHHIASNNVNSAIVGGNRNRISNITTNSQIFGGFSNTISGGTIQVQNVTILGGSSNLINPNGILSNLLIIGGTGSNISGTSTNSLILGGSTNKIGAGTTGLIVGGNTNIINAGGTNSVIVGGLSNKLNVSAGNNNVIVGGAAHNLRNSTGSLNNSSIFGGDTNSLLGSSTSNIIAGGNNNTISGNTAGSTISYSGLFAGTTNKLTYVGSQNAIIAGATNTISGNTGLFPTNSTIIGGSNNKINGSVARAAIIGGQNITLTGLSQNDFVTVPSLMLWNTPTAGNQDDVLTWNSITKKTTKVTQLSLGNRYSKVAWVSSTGNDSTGQVGNIFAPYATMNAAITAVNSAMSGTLSKANRGLVHVMPGQYNVTSNIQMINFIDLYLDSAHIVTGNLGLSSYVINMPSTLTPHDIVVDGTGRISITGTTGVIGAIGGVGPAGTVKITLDEINLTVSSTLAVTTFITNSNTNPVLHFRCKRVTSVNPANVIGQFAGCCYVECDYFQGTMVVMWGVIKVKSQYGLCTTFGGGSAYAGTLDYYGDITSTGNTNYALNISPNTTNAPYFFNYYGNAISDFSGGAVVVNMIGGGVTAGCRARIFGSAKSTFAGNAPAITVNSPHLALIGGTYLVAAGTGASIAGSTTVYLYGNVVANNAKGGGITTAIGTLTVDPNVL